MITITKNKVKIFEKNYKKTLNTEEFSMITSEIVKIPISSLLFNLGLKNRSFPDFSI